MFSSPVLVFSRAENTLRHILVWEVLLSPLLWTSTDTRTHTERERDIKSFFLRFSLFSRLHCFLFNDIYHEHDYQSQTTGCQTTENRLKQNYSALLCFHFLKFPKCKSIEFIISNTIFHLCIQKKKVDTELFILNVQIQSRWLLSQAQHTYNSNKTVPWENYKKK